MARKPPFHGSNMGSNPIGVTELMLFSIQLNFVWYGLGKRKKKFIGKTKIPAINKCVASQPKAYFNAEY